MCIAPEKDVCIGNSVSTKSVPSGIFEDIWEKFSVIDATGTCKVEVRVSESGHFSLPTIAENILPWCCRNYMRRD